MYDCRISFLEWDALPDYCTKASEYFADSICNGNEQPDKWQRAMAFHAAWMRQKIHQAMNDVIVYTVTAYRWGNRDKHSYIVGVYSSAYLAIKAATSEDDFRGGKYSCEVLEWEINQDINSVNVKGPKTIMALPKRDINR